MDSRLGALEVADLFEDLVILREATQCLLREDQIAVGNDLEDTAAAIDQLCLDAELALDGGRQTGGLGAVVSFHAVFDGDSHGLLLWRVGNPRPAAFQLEDRA